MPFRSNAPTERQTAVLEVIRRSLAERRIPPTVREIMAALSIANPNGVVCHLKALERKRLLILLPGIARGLIPTDETTRCCPTCGARLTDHQGGDER